MNNINNKSNKNHKRGKIEDVFSMNNINKMKMMVTKLNDNKNIYFMSFMIFQYATKYAYLFHYFIYMCVRKKCTHKRDLNDK